MGFSVNLLNSIRSAASTEYQERIPLATRTNISELGEALETYTPLFNEYQSALINKIGKTMIEAKLYKNKLARFKKGKATPHDVEEIFIEMASTLRLASLEESGVLTERANFNDLYLMRNSGPGIDMALAGSGTTPNSAIIMKPFNNVGGIALSNFGQPEVKALYHRQNRQDVYPVTIGDLDFKRVFRSEGTHDEFVTGLINSLYSGAAYDEWIIMKELIGSYSGYKDYFVPFFNAQGGDSTTPNSVNTMERFLATVRKASQDLSFASTNYNAAGVVQWVEPKKQVLIIHKDVMAETDVTTLAKCFNVHHMDFPIDNIIVVDDFGETNATFEMNHDSTTYAILADEDIFRIWDTLFHFEPQRNALGLYTNHFLHVHQILSMSKFKNAVRIMATSEWDREDFGSGEVG